MKTHSEHKKLIKVCNMTLVLFLSNLYSPTCFSWLCFLVDSCPPISERKDVQGTRVLCYLRQKLTNFPERL